MQIDIDKSEPKARKKLNAEQLEVLELLHKFRFGSNDLIAQYFGKKDRSFVFKRLSILLEQGLIGKRFDSSYRIQGKPAAYYLTPTGARILQERRSQEKPAINIKAIYKDKTVKDDFIGQCLDIFATYNRLKAQHGDKLKFFARANLNYEHFDYFPKPLPDAYMRLRSGKEEKQYFLNFYYDSQPFFKAVKRIQAHVEYAESGDWDETGTALPTLLNVCESASLYKRLQKKITKLTDNTWNEDIRAAITTKSDLFSDSKAIWQSGEPEDPIKKLEEL